MQFALDRVSHEIDLSTEIAAGLRRSSHQDKGRRVGGRQRPSSRSSPTGASELQRVREWALQNGYQVSDRDGVPQEIQEADHAAG